MQVCLVCSILWITTYVHDCTTGSVYVYVTYDGGRTYSEQQKLLSFSGVANEWFGRLVTVHGDMMVVGANQGQSGKGTFRSYALCRITNT